ncbi:MAG: hypothetical protein ACFFDP_12255 [Promethearchaeota archaeon]
MEAYSKPETLPTEKPIDWCPVCGTNLSEKGTDVDRDVCPSCGFDLLLVKPSKALAAPEKTPARVPRFAYVVLAIQACVSLLLGLVFYFFSSSLYIGLPDILAYTFFLSVIVSVVFYVILRIGKSVSAVRIGLLIFGFFSLPLGGCAIAAALSISTVSRFCVICGKRIIWGASYSECPHCQSSFHRWGRCRLTRVEIIANAWGRDPARSEIDNTCPQCFQNIKLIPVGGEQA